MAGRKMSFKKYLSLELKRLTNSNDFRLSSFCDNLSFTAIPYAYVYSFYYSNLNLFLKTMDNEKYRNVVLPELPDNYQDLVSFKKNNMEYYKVIQGYNTYLDHSSANSNLKILYKNTINEKLSNYSVVSNLCKDANVSQGNLTMFLKGDLSKLSLDKCRSLINCLN